MSDKSHSCKGQSKKQRKHGSLLERVFKKLGKEKDRDDFLDKIS